MVKRKTGQFSAHVIQSSAQGEEFGSDLLGGTGLRDLAASWERARFRSMRLAEYWELVPERREDLDPMSEGEGVHPYELAKRSNGKVENNEAHKDVPFN